MLKNSLKKIGAVVCAFAMAAQLVVMPTASAIKLENDTPEFNMNNIIEEPEVIEAISYDANGVTLVKEFNLGTLDKTADIVVDFDLTLNTPQAPDAGKGDVGRGRTAFYAELAGSDSSKYAGGVFHINTSNDTAATFHWKWTSTAALSGATLNYGQTYNVAMRVTNSNSIVLKITDENGNVITNVSGLSMRANTIAQLGKIIFGLNSQVDGTPASVTVDNLRAYNMYPDSIDVTFDGKTVTEDGITVELPTMTGYTGALAVSPMLDGVASGMTVVKELTMSDGSNLPNYITLKEDAIIADVLLEGGEGGTVLEYDMILNAYLESKPSMGISVPIKFTKIGLSDSELIDAFVPEIKDINGNVIASGDVSDDITLGKGNHRLKVEWSSSNEEVISPETGVVMPLPEDETVTIEGRVSSIELPTYYEEDGALTDEQLAEISAGTAAKGKVVTYTYNVKGVKAIVDAAIAGMKFVSADDKTVEIDFANAVNSDIALPAVYSADKNVQFAWTTKDNANVTISKTNVAELIQKTLDSVDVVITGVVTYVKNGEVLYESEEVEQEFTIDMTQEGTADKYIVRCDAAATKNFKDCPEDGDTIDSAKDICDGDGLPTKGIFGSKIEWSSSVPSAISNTGKTVKRQSVRKLVTLTATISKGNADAATYKIEDLIVPSSSGSTSGGSGGGSGSSNSNTAVSSTGNKASNVSYKGTLVPTTSLQKGDITTATVVSFSDLGDAAWAKDAVTFLANKAIINGKTASSFAPNDDITRAEFAKIVVKAFGLEDVNATVSNFSDVSASDWYYTAVASAYNKGIIKGYEDGTFGVNDKITRQDMAVIIYRAAQVAGKTIAPVKDAVVFDDAADIASYATEAVAALQKGGVINGMTATTFAPTATATRAQAAQMIYGLVK